MHEGARISREQFGTLARKCGANATEAELNSYFEEADQDGNGTIDGPDFLTFMERKLVVRVDSEESN